MHHETPLISILVGGFVLAFVFGALAHRLRLPPLVGYLVAGVLVGPHTPGFVANQQLAPQLAEIGVILLMFGVGLHFSVKELWAVRAVALPGAIAQMAVATALGWGLAALMGWSFGGGIIFGLALSVASTVVLLKALQERRLVDSERGKIAVGWLIVEDLAMVLALVLLPAAASLNPSDHGAADPLAATIGQALGLDLGLSGLVAVTLAKVAVFVGLMLVVGRRLVPALLHWIAHSGSRELFRLGVLAIALGIAFGAAQLFGVSLALGAFFAGMVLSESPLSQAAASESLPLRDAFAVLFFVSAGMLFDPTIALRDPWPVLATVFVIVIGKSIAAFLIVLAFRRSVGTALTISASLAQIGEFSFILAELGLKLNLLPSEGRDLILAGAIISIILNPAVFYLTDRLRPRLEARFPGRAVRAASAAERDATAPEPTAETQGDRTETPTALTGHVVLVGSGRVGGIVAEHLRTAQAPFLVIEDAEARIAALRAAGVEVIAGNVAAAGTLDLANIGAAATFVIAIPNAFEAGQAVEQARASNPPLHIVARAHSDAEVEHLRGLGADVVIMGEREIARAMLVLLRERGVAPDEAAGPPLIRPAPPAA
ncbi:YbaL family putative K(+) efflux transporter [Hansschlegelia sp. KR7-227]|uniref:YbaL family putative K(+) efflux transporter n=1 Tax=Hansschlegelia sp. KR7-227 TaxID=3400914 RepID=UPI003C127403